MRSTGIVRNIDALGRIVLPKELRKQYKLEVNAPLEIFTQDDMILLRRYQPSGACEFCGEVSDDMVEFHGRKICRACLKEMQKL